MGRNARYLSEGLFVLVGALLFYVGSGIVAGWPLVVVLSLWAFLLPGYCLRRWAIPPAGDAASRAAMMFLMGIAAQLVPLFLGTIAGLDLSVMRHFVPGVVIVAWGATLWRGALSARAHDTGADGSTATVATGERDLHGGRAIEAIVIGCAVVVFALVLTAGAPVDATKDTLDHVAYVSEVATSDEVFPRTAFYIENDDNGRDIRKGLLHAVYGTLSKAAGTSALATINAINALFAAMFVLVIYAMALAFTCDRRIALLSVILFALGESGGLAVGALRFSYYPNRFGSLFFFAFLTYGLDYLHTQNRSRLVSAAMMAFAASATHIFYVIVIAAAGTVMLLWKVTSGARSWTTHAQRVVVLGISSGVPVLAYALFRYVTASPQANELHSEVQGVVFVSNVLYIANPLKQWQWFGPIGVVAMACALVFWRDPRRSNGVAYAMASLLTVPLVLFNPLLMPLLHRVMTYLVFRINVIAPFYIVAAAAVVWTFSDWSNRRTPSRLRHVLVGLVLISLAVASRPLFGTNAYSPSSLSDERAHSYQPWQEDLAALAALPGPAVVASDPITSYAITAFTPHKVVATLGQHAPPNDLDVDNRVRAARDIMSPFQPMATSVTLIQERDVRYIVVNDHVPRTRLHYWWINPDSTGTVRNRLASAADLFRVVYDRNGFTVFEYSGGVPAADADFDNPLVIDAMPPWPQVNRQAGDALLVAYWLDAQLAVRGETFDMRFLWATSEPHALGNQAVVVRFDHIDPQLPLAGRPFRKIARKVKESITGVRYRFRHEHKVGGGLFGLDAWRPEFIYQDGVRISIPSDMAEGRYRVSVKMLTMTNQPNYRLGDFLFDQDVFQGPAVTEILIR